MSGPLELIVAVPKGRLLPEIAAMFSQAGLPVDGLSEEGRLRVRAGDGVEYLLMRPSDVTTYVREGAADLGVTGKDIILENPEGCVELVDMRVGACRLSVAGVLPPGMTWQEFLARKGNRLRIATKHPNASRNYFASLGLEPVIIPLAGALELAPLVGLADVIVDLVQTGRTLRINGLQELAVIAPVTARLIANTVSFRFKMEAIEGLAQALRRVAAGDGPGAGGRG